MGFAEQLLDWYDEQKRDLIWRQTKDPYHIWLSEIIMQQTQIIQGTSYYIKFIETFPTIFQLAKASEQDILVLWQGLGYYSRARNLHHTAKEIVCKYNGKFPETYEELTALKGIGDYTASAILSVCLNQNYPALDGNVMRVISRLFEIKEPINKPVGKNKIKDICKTLISKNRPGDFNQAMMDFGATQCTPRNANCETCLFNENCSAYLNDVVYDFPVKDKAAKKTKEYMHYFICEDMNSDQILIQKRTDGIWKNLYQFPLVLTFKRISKKNAINLFIETYKLEDKIITPEASKEQKHILSHKELHIRFYRAKISFKTNFEVPSNHFLVAVNKLIDFPFPIVIKKYIEHNILPFYDTI